MLAEHYYYSLHFRGRPPAEQLGGRIFIFIYVVAWRHNQNTTYWLSATQNLYEKIIIFKSLKELMMLCGTRLDTYERKCCNKKISTALAEFVIQGKLVNFVIPLIE